MGEKESNEKKYIICNDPKLQTLTKATTEEEKVVSDKHTIEEEIKNQKILLMNDETIVSIKKEKEVHAVKDINKNENENNQQEEKIITLDTKVTKKDENIKKLAIEKLITKEKKHELISTNLPLAATETVESSQSELGSESFKTRIQKIENKKKAKNAIA